MMQTILVIEDNDQNLYLTTYLLERGGFAVAQAQSGPEGVSLAKLVRPSLIIMDIQLPLMDGYAVAREIRASRELDRVPIVAVTSYAMVGDRERSLAAGCNGYIEKPIDPDTFMSEIEYYMKAGTQAQDAPKRQ